MKQALILIFMLLSSLVFAQQKSTVKGLVVDENGQAIPFATISILSAKDSSNIATQLTKENGAFEFSGLSMSKYVFKISVVGYVTTFHAFSITETITDLGKVQVNNADNVLNEVVVKGNKEPVAVKKDTLEFDAGVLKPQQNDNLEDLLKKVPALEIDENGGIKTQNKVIKKIYIDGKEFFGNDPQLALKNLPAESIEKIQVVEKKTEQAEFSGVDDGEREMVINVTLKNTHKKGTFGFGSVAGIPSMATTEAYYNAKTSINRFSPSEQFSVIGLLNNLNQQGFTPQDAANFSSLNAQSNRGGGGNASANVNLPIVVGKRPGVISTEGAGFNYNNQYAKKSSLQSSYFFNASHTDLVRNLFRQSFLPAKTINTDQNTKQNRDNFNHRLNATLTHQFNERNLLKFTTALNTVSGDALTNSLSKISTFTTGDTVENNSNRTVRNHSQGLSFNNNLLLRHRFALPRRTVSLNAVFNLNNDKNNDSTNTLNQNQVNGTVVERIIKQENDRRTNQQNQRIQLAFTEPLAKTMTLEGNYAYQQNVNRSNFDVWDIVNNNRVPNLTSSNAYSSNFNFQQAGFKVNNETKIKTFMVGLFYQKSVLQSVVRRGTDNVLERSFQNVLPSLRYSFRKDANKNKANTKSKSITLEYNTAVNEPSVRDLQPITVNNNPQNIVLGNPDLKPEYIHRVIINENIFNPKTFTNIGLNGNLNYTQNAIGYAQTVSETLVRTTQPVNLPYRWNANLGFYYNFSVGKQKNKIRFSISPRYLVSKGNNMVNGVNNLNTQNQYRGDFKITYLTDKINFVFNTNYQKSFVEYSVNKEFNQTFSVFKNITDFRWKITKEFTIATDFDYTYYQSSRLSTNLRPIPILNVAVKHLFLKNNRGELMLSAQDVFKRNVYLSQRSDENFFEIDRSNTLSRYFLLTFTYTVRNQQGGGKK
ncbi:collagen-binding protein [Emticicia aquatilis]|uniref:Collagen-binding protein n=1 Tax=Emticicia aquatilis TaxID=1537369 RepID=A0A916Z5D2_9BACT|nr:TonB-dependent receptor [Emticicia aquatilis]GGD74583.1 collagen-binding protein [Emticicia aquatilis]